MVTIASSPLSDEHHETSAVASTPSLEQFLVEARAFLDANATPKPAVAAEFVWGEGDDFVGIVEEGDPETEVEQLAAARAWAAKRFDAGFGWIDGPIELGGRGLGADQSALPVAQPPTSPD